MTLHVHNPNPNAFVRFMRKIYNPIGFKKGYNFTLFVIFAGAMFGFGLARLEYLSVEGIFKHNTAPGLFYYYREKFYKIGLYLHLCCVIPAAILLIWQFVPAIRHRALLFHRLNGYILLLLLLVGNVGALMIARVAFGGTLDTQVMVGLLAIATTASAALAWWNIKCLQIDQHRAWMLRCWFYAGSIITLRMVFGLMALIISRLGGYYINVPCGMIAYVGGNATAYPNCAANMDGETAVVGNMATPVGVEQVVAALNMSFGAAGVIAFFMHAVGVEIYLALTPAEGERLRRVSYERQLERGFSNPGSTGLTVDRLGDAEKWTPPVADSKVQGEVVDESNDTSDDVAVVRPQPSGSLGWR